MIIKRFLILWVVGTIFLSGCAVRDILRDAFTREKPLETVTKIEISKYLGQWYAVASFPTWFERDCACTSANYSLMENGRIKVVNRCFRNGKFTDAVGEAWPINKKDFSRLYVSFRKPFKGKYFIIALATDYSYVLVGHPNRNYLWILSRTPHLPPETISELKIMAREKGFDVSRLRPVSQDCPLPD